MSKYKYYFKKPKSEITKDILTWLFIAGIVCVAASSPYFIWNITRSFFRNIQRPHPKKKTYNTFYMLWKRGYIDIKKHNHQIYISLTEEGRKKAGMFQINSLEVKRQKKWDKKWRLVMFDISEKKKIKRGALRGKLKELGFFPLQKSVWVHAYPCSDEIELLKDFFGLSSKEVRVVTADDIGDASFLKKIFKLK